MPVSITVMVHVARPSVTRKDLSKRGSLSAALSFRPASASTIRRRRRTLRAARAWRSAWPSDAPSGSTPARPSTRTASPVQTQTEPTRKAWRGAAQRPSSSVCDYDMTNVPWKPVFMPNLCLNCPHLVCGLYHCGESSRWPPDEARLLSKKLHYTPKRFYRFAMQLRADTPIRIWNDRRSCRSCSPRPSADHSCRSSGRPCREGRCSRP